MLAFKDENVWIKWISQDRPKGGEGSFQLPRNVEAAFSDADLADYGLHRVEPATVPDGHRVLYTSIIDVDGLPTEFITHEPIPEPGPVDFPLTNRQLRLGLIRNGIGLSAVQSVIGTIPDPVARDEAQVWWEYTDLIHWDHPMTQTLIALMGIPLESASAMWMAAKDYVA